MLGCAIAPTAPGMLAMPTRELPSANPLKLVDFAAVTAVPDRQRVVLPAPLTRLVSREVGSGCGARCCSFLPTCAW